MSEPLLRNSDYGNSRAGNVSGKLSMFPEVHLYKTEIDDKSSGKSRNRAESRMKHSQPAVKPAAAGKVKPNIPSAPRKTGVKQKRAGAQRVFIFIILFLLVVLAIELIFHFFISPKLLIKKVRVEVDGTLELSRNDIVQIAGINSDSNYFRFKTDEAAEQLSNFPLIREAAVKKQFPDSVLISVTGRSPLALSLVETEEGHIPVVFDHEGVVFQIGKSVQNMDMLCISGVRFNELKLGMRMPEQIMTLLEDLAKVQKESLSLFGMISEIRIVNRGGGRVEALLYAEKSSVPVRIGMSLDLNQLKYLFMILEVTAQDAFSDKIEEIDLRSGDVVYKSKEAENAE